MKHKLFTRLRLAVCLLCLSAGVGTVSAQTVTGSLVGNVADPNGNIVPGARIVITDVSRGASRETTTNEEGNYTFSSLDPGAYQVEVEAQGFGKFTREATEVAINTVVRVDAQLTTGDVTESVEVSADALLLKTDRADVSQQLRAEQIEELPLSPDRNYQAALEIVPGVDPAAPVGSAFGNPGGSLTNRVNGQNERNNNFQLDGTINNQTNVISQSAIVPPPEAIQVVDLSTNAYDAEQGRATGAVVNVAIKSGTNDLSGSVYLFNTNSALGARDTFSTLEKPGTKLTQFGFTIGGPIIKNKTFFFGDYQGGRDRQGQNTLLTVPSLAFRNGDFTGASAIFDPATGTPAGANRTQFANNIIPANRISPIARAILARLPLPTRPGNANNYEAVGSFIQDRDQFDVKINHIFSDNTTAFARYSYFQADTQDAPAFGVLGGPATDGGATAAFGPSRIQSGSLNLTHSFSSTLVTEFRGGLVRVLIEGEPPSEDDLATQLGIPGINNGDFFSRGFPRIAFPTGSFDALGAATTLPFKIAETSFQGVNNWTKTTGNHTIRFGADIRNLILNKFQAGGSNPRGEFIFANGVTSRSGTTGATSANAFASFLLGLPQEIRRTTVLQLGGYRQRQYFFYAQDRWQVTKNLTVNYGLRYEIQPYSTPANAGDQSRYVVENNQVLIAGRGDVDERLGVRTDYTSFAPRGGIAYRLGERTVLRAGYGIGYVPLNLNQLTTQNFGGQIDVQLQGANAFQPFGNIANGIPALAPINTTSGIVTPPANVVLGVINPEARRGFVQSFNGTIEHDFRGFVATASYVGARGSRLPGARELNYALPLAPNAQGVARALTPQDRVLFASTGRTANTILYDNFLESAYDSLQTKVERRFRSLGTVTAAYTFSKSIDYSDAFALQDDANLDLNRGLSDFDRPHNFVLSHVIRLPFFDRGRQLFDERGLTPGAIFGGFTLSGTFSARSGTPIDIRTNLNANNTPLGDSFARRPNIIGAPRILGGTGPGDPYFDPTVFVAPLQGQLGNVGRNTVRGPGFINYNAALSRTFSISETIRLQLRADAFNVTNTPRFANPNATLGASTFGQITSTVANSERRIRLGLKLTF